MMNYQTIRTDRQFKDATGYDRSSFAQLLADYEATYESLHGESYETYLLENVSEEAKLETLGDALFFVLFQLKNDLIYGTLSLVFGMSVAGAHKNFRYFSDLLAHTLQKKSNAEAKL